MRLPIPIWNGDTCYVEAELVAPSPDAISATQEATDKGVYRGVVAFLTGCISALVAADGTRVTARAEISALVRLMPYQSAEPLAIYALLEGDADDGIEGVYHCPRCTDGVVVSEHTPDDDSRDHVRDLPITYLGKNADGTYAETPRVLVFSLTAPVRLAGAGAAGTPVVDASECTMHWPTLADCIAAETEIPGRASARQQMAIYQHAVELIDGQAYTPGVLGAYAHSLVHGMSREDMKRLGAEMSKYGIANTVRKACPKCTKVWQVVINTSNFFVSALGS